MGLGATEMTDADPIEADSASDACHTHEEEVGEPRLLSPRRLAATRWPSLMHRHWHAPLVPTTLRNGSSPCRTGREPRRRRSLRVAGYLKPNVFVFIVIVIVVIVVIVVAFVFVRRFFLGWLSLFTAPDGHRAGRIDDARVEQNDDPVPERDSEWYY